MPEPQQVHIDAALTNVSLAYRNADYIAELIAPAVPVRKQSDRYYIYDAARESIRTADDVRSPGAIASEIDYALSTDSYFCSDHALASAVTDEERENADPVIQPDIDRTEFLTERLLLNQEVSLETALRNSSEIEQNTIPDGSEWSEDTSDPIADVREARMAVMEQSQRRANVMVLPYTVYETVRNHPAIIDMIKYGGNSVATPDVLAQLFDVDRVLVPRACQNIAAQGQPADITPVWSNNVYIAHIAPRPGLKQVTLAHTFVWSGTAGSTGGVIVERWRENGRKADMIRVQKYYDQKIVAPGAAFRISNTIAE